MRLDLVRASGEDNETGADDMSPEGGWDTRKEWKTGTGMG